MHLIQGKGFVAPSLRVNLAQGVQQNVELPSTITDNDQIGTTAMLQYTTEQSPFGGDLTMPFAQEIKATFGGGAFGPAKELIADMCHVTVLALVPCAIIIHCHVG